MQVDNLLPGGVVSRRIVIVVGVLLAVFPFFLYESYYPSFFFLVGRACNLCDVGLLSFPPTKTTRARREGSKDEEDDRSRGGIDHSTMHTRDFFLIIEHHVPPNQPARAIHQANQRGDGAVDRARETL